jgi:copper chaperone CopZ
VGERAAVAVGQATGDRLKSGALPDTPLITKVLRNFNPKRSGDIYHRDNRTELGPMCGHGVGLRTLVRGVGSFRKRRFFMKSRAMGFAVLALALLAAPAGVADEIQQAPLPEGQVRVVVPVKGMTCGGCCIPVETAVKKLEGVVDATADYEKGQATITYEKDKVTVEKIVDAINTTSFKASMPEKKDS